MKATKTSVIRCSSGGDNTLLHTRRWPAALPFTPATGDDGAGPDRGRDRY